MKKIVLLASLMALAALTLAATPAFAQDGGDNQGDRITVCHKEEGQGNVFRTMEIEPSALPAHLGHGDTLGPCEDDGDDGDDGDDNGEDNGDDNDNDNDNNRDVFRNVDVGNVGIEAPIDISQEIEQECESGDISQPVSVTGGGDNSIQTVGLQPTANTGCAQNATGVLQAAPIVAGLGGDAVFNVDDNNGNNDDDLVFCDFDDDGNDDGDDCDDFDNDRVFCDRDRDGNDDGDDDCFVFDNDDNDNDNDRDVFRNIGNDELNITGPDFGDVEVDSDASIDLSPSQVVKGGGTIDQTATAESNTFLVKPWWL